MAIDQEKLSYWFERRNVQPEQEILVESIRHTAKAFAQSILDHTPPSSDQSAAIRKVREAMLIAMDAATGGRY